MPGQIDTDIQEEDIMNADQLKGKWMQFKARTR
jgi:hypothetical protein